MTNADKFKSIFGLYATELWSMPEKDFLKWLNSEAMNCSEFPNNWIPCSERLPKKEERSYWICLDGGGQCQCRWTNDMYGFGANEYSKWGWHIMDKPQYSKVVAWMPLPEPYGGEQE